MVNEMSDFAAASKAFFLLQFFFHTYIYTHERSSALGEMKSHALSVIASCEGRKKDLRGIAAC